MANRRPHRPHPAKSFGEHRGPSPNAIAAGAEAIRPSSATYRPDIDGLRAIAVLAVLIFHAFPSYAPGGFIGVDVFFVISGYLITSIIAKRLNGGRFRIRDFYAARIRRIFPALVTVLAATLAIGWLIFVEGRYQELGRHVAASAVFSANLIFWSEINYFNALSGEKPLLHLWSLGVEEQFYLAWPVLLVLTSRFGRRFASVAAAILILSLGYSIWVTFADPATAFYSPFSRAWELMLGALLALKPLTSGGRTGNFVSLAGLGMLATGFAVIDANAPFPGWRALVPCVATAALISAGPNAVVNRHFLSWHPIVFVGLISYPLYLWHFPLLAFATIIQFGATPAAPIRAGLLAASFVLAWATYRWVETSAAFRRRIRVPQLLLLMAVACATGIFIARDGVPGRPITHDVRREFVEHYDALKWKAVRSDYREECSFLDEGANRAKETIAASCTAPGANGTVFLWGDSHAQSLSWGLRRALPAGVNLAQVATGGCRLSMTPTDRPSPGDACNRSNAFARAAISRLKPQTLILVQREGHETRDWLEFARWARSQGVRETVLLGPLPEWLPTLPQVIAKSYWGQGRSRIPGITATVIRTDSLLRRRYGSSSEIKYISLLDRLCTTDGCLAVVPGDRNGTLIALDYSHLSREGATYLARTIIAPELAMPAGASPRSHREVSRSPGTSHKIG